MTNVSALVKEVKSEKELETILEEAKKTPTLLLVLNFWADWSGPSKHMNAVFQQLADLNPHSVFLNVEAENLTDITEKYEVTSAPTFIFLKDGKVIDRLEGANAPALTKKVGDHKGHSTTPISSSTPTESLNERLQKLLHSAPALLFMKGTPEQPRCGFSSKIVQLLKKDGINFSHFDILQDMEVREGLKKFSNWPSYPQLYFNGELIGGLDIVKEQSEQGELRSLAPSEALE